MTEEERQELYDTYIDEENKNEFKEALRNSFYIYNNPIFADTDELYDELYSILFDFYSSFLQSDMSHQLIVGSINENDLEAKDYLFVDGITKDNIEQSYKNVIEKLKEFSEKYEKEKVKLLIDKKEEIKKDNSRTKICIQTIEFTLKAVEKERQELDLKIKKIEKYINELRLNGNTDDSISKKYGSQLDKLKALKVKIDEDYDYLKSLFDSLNNYKLENFVDPIIKYEEEERLNNKKLDLESSRTESSAAMRISNLQAEINATNELYNKLISECNNVDFKEKLKEDYRNKIQLLTKRVSNIEEYKNLSDDKRNEEIALTEEELNELESKTVKDSHENYKATYAIVQSTFTEKDFAEIKGGESIFHHIISTTEDYEKNKEMIDKLERKLKDLDIKNELERDDMSKFAKKAAEKERERIKNSIERIKGEQIAIKSEQKLLLMKKEEVIRKRSELIAKFENKAEKHAEEGHGFRENYYKFKAQRLSGEEFDYFDDKAFDHQVDGHRIRAGINRFISNRINGEVPEWIDKATNYTTNFLDEQTEILKNDKNSLFPLITVGLSKTASHLGEGLTSLFSISMHKPIKIASASKILMQEELKVQLKLKKSTSLNGKIEDRSWQEIALENMGGNIDLDNSNSLEETKEENNVKKTKVAEEFFESLKSEIEAKLSALEKDINDLSSSASASESLVSKKQEYEKLSKQLNKINKFLHVDETNDEKKKKGKGL